MNKIFFFFSILFLYSAYAEDYSCVGKIKNTIEDRIKNSSTEASTLRVFCDLPNKNECNIHVTVQVGHMPAGNDVDLSKLPSSEEIFLKLADYVHKEVPDFSYKKTFRVSLSNFSCD